MIQHEKELFQKHVAKLNATQVLAYKKMMADLKAKF